MSKHFFEDRRPHNGLNYQEYLALMEEGVQRGAAGTADPDEQKLLEYMKLNYQRSLRVRKTYSMSAEMLETLQQLNQPQLWMVLTEIWCGDSAQSLPVLAQIAEASDKIDLKILLRDENLDIMDQYLVNGSRGIPRLIAFSEAGEELFNWGPRPEAASILFEEGKKKGLSKEEIYPQLHLWYGRERGKAIERELLEMLQQR